MRKPIPGNIRSNILLANRHLCCVCKQGAIQIHHINSDPSDNSLENLSVLCLNHHEMATAPKGVTARLKPEEIIKYKNSWEEECSKTSHLIARSRTAFFMVDYKNAERIRQLYSQLKQNELNHAYSLLRGELIEEDRLRKEQGYDVSLEPNLSLNNYVIRLVEEIKSGDPHPKIFKDAPGHPKDSLYPAGPAFSPPKPFYDIWCQIMVRCLILSRKVYNIEDLMSFENIEDIDINGSLITFNGFLNGDVNPPGSYKTNPIGYTQLTIKDDMNVWLSKLSIKTHYVYSETAAESLSKGRSQGVLFFRSIDDIEISQEPRKIKFSCTPLIMGCGGGGPLKIS